MLKYLKKVNVSVAVKTVVAGTALAAIGYFMGIAVLVSAFSFFALGALMQRFYQARQTLAKIAESAVNEAFVEPVSTTSPVAQPAVVASLGPTSEQRVLVKDHVRVYGGNIVPHKSSTCTAQ